VGVVTGAIASVSTLAGVTAPHHRNFPHNFSICFGSGVDFILHFAYEVVPQSSKHILKYICFIIFRQ